MLIENTIISISKEDSSLEAKYYRPFSVLLYLSKRSWRFLKHQMSLFVEDILSENQFGFSQGHSSQQCLLLMIEKWKKCLDKSRKCKAL